MAYWGHDLIAVVVVNVVKNVNLEGRRGFRKAKNKEEHKGVDMDLTSAAAATLISVLTNIVLYYKLNNKNTQKWLDDQLDAILKISIEYPYLEDQKYTAQWNPEKTSDEQHIRYENYCTLIFNFLEKLCEYYSYDRKKIEKFMNVKAWVRMHRKAWENPSIEYENADSYSSEFKQLVEDYLK